MPVGGICVQPYLIYSELLFHIIVVQHHQVYSISMVIKIEKHFS